MWNRVTVEQSLMFYIFINSVQVKSAVFIVIVWLRGAVQW